jgi:predicted Mrr-cat superfamily restriction endonuclease
VSDEFTNNVAVKFPNTSNKESVEKPWDVTEPKLISPVKKLGEELKREDMAERIHHLYSELRSSLTVPAALEFDLKRANQILEEVNRIKVEIEKVIEMLRVMEEYMKERIK